MNTFWQFVRDNKTWLFGAAVGLVAAILMLTIGFFPTLLIVLLVTAGALITGRSDIREKIKAFFYSLFAKIFKK